MKAKTDGRSDWPFHPKYVGALIAAVFLSAFFLTFVYEPPAFPAELRALLAIIGGSGVTAWLTMTIYEYITRKTQRAGWKHQFDVDNVREVYGPVYNEMRRNLELLTLHFSPVKWAQAHAVFQLQYMALLVPDHLIQLEKDFERLADGYNRLHDETVGQLNNRVRSLTNSYLADIGGPASLIESLYGAESRYLLGAKHPDFQRTFQKFITDVEKVCDQNRLNINLNEFEEWLRSQIRANPDGMKLLQKHGKLMDLTKEMIAILERPIKAPYDV